MPQDSFAHRPSAFGNPLTCVVSNRTHNLQPHQVGVPKGEVRGTWRTAPVATPWRMADVRTQYPRFPNLWMRLIWLRPQPPKPAFGTDNSERVLTPFGGKRSASNNPLLRLRDGVLRMAPRQPLVHLADRLASGLPQGLGIPGS